MIHLRELSLKLVSNLNYAPKTTSRIKKTERLTGCGRVAVELVERLAGHLEQGVQRRRVVVVLAGGLVLARRGRGRRRWVRLGTAGDLRAGAALAAVGAGPAAGARGRLVVGRLGPVLEPTAAVVVQMVVVLLLLLLLVLEVLDEQRVREQGADDGLSVSRRRRRWRRGERTARRLILLGPRPDDFRRVLGSGRRGGGWRWRRLLLAVRLVTEDVGYAERLDAGRGLRVFGRGGYGGPATGRGHRHHVHRDAATVQQLRLPVVLLLLLLLLLRRRSAFGRVALAVADAVTHLVNADRSQFLERAEVVGTDAAVIVTPTGARRRRAVGIIAVAAARALVEPGVTLGRGRRRWPADADVVHVVGGRAPGRPAPDDRVTAQVRRVTAAVVTALVDGGAVLQRYGFHAIRGPRSFNSGGRRTCPGGRARAENRHGTRTDGVAGRKRDARNRRREKIAKITLHATASTVTTE